MKNILIGIFILIGSFGVCFGQTDSVIVYIKSTAMIPMRDGIKLYTVILTPLAKNELHPVLIQRTPYGAGFGPPQDSLINFREGSSMYGLGKGGYIFVSQ